MSQSAEDIQKKIAELRITAQQHVKSNRAGSSKNTRSATDTRREIARQLTKLNQLNKEGRKE